jgi:spectinomycin phosphotransferase
VLQKPDLQEQKIIAVLQEYYEIRAAEILFLPLGADLNTAVYRVVAKDGTPYFLKLRRGDFDETTVTVPKFLHDVGIGHLIAPFSTKTGTLWTQMDAFHLILYPFIEGDNGYQVQMSEAQWHDMGTAFRQIHTTVIPSALQHRLPREHYSPEWRDKVKNFLAQEDGNTFTDPIAVELFAFLANKRDEIVALVARTEQLAQILVVDSPEAVLCHADIHAGNVLVEPNGLLYIVDWDTLLMAPKERDLMFFGAGLWGGWHTPQEEKTLFFGGYGETDIDQTVLTYYRLERIAQDIAVDCTHILQTDADPEDRAQSLYYLKGNFQLNSTIALAYESDPLHKK